MFLQVLLSLVGQTILELHGKLSDLAISYPFLVHQWLLCLARGEKGAKHHDIER